MKEIRHINAISLYVADTARSAAFYRRVFEADIFEPGPGNIVVKLEGILLNLLDMKLAYEPTGPERGALPMELNIWVDDVIATMNPLDRGVDDVDAVYGELVKRGVAFLAPPADQPWGMRNITFFDPDGHRFEIAQAISG